MRLIGQARVRKHRDGCVLCTTTTQRVRVDRKSPIELGTLEQIVNVHSSIGACLQSIAATQKVDTHGCVDCGWQ
eukprot:3670678-Rhodomonas_salina.1